jgi:hypothetical protein
MDRSKAALPPDRDAANINQADVPSLALGPAVVPVNHALSTSSQSGPVQVYVMRDGRRQIVNAAPTNLDD